MTEQGRNLTSLFVMRSGSFEYIRPGCAFRRTRKDGVRETAEILAVYKDPAGNPHVRFDLVFEKPDCETYREGPRVLALETFFETFDERVAG